LIIRNLKCNCILITIENQYERFLIKHVMKKLTIIIILAAFTFTGNAQGFFDFGPKIGINTSKMSTNVADYNPQTISKFQFGAFARINVGRFYIQPEAYYNSKGGEYISTVGVKTINSFNLQSVDVPALLGFKLINQKDLNLRIMTGPVLSILTDKSVKGQFTEDNLKNSVFAWQYGVGVDFLFLSLDARMESHSSNFYDSPDFNTKNGNFVISLGLKLF